MEQCRRVAVCVLFFLILFLTPVLFFILPDKEISSAERRKLQQAPALSAEGVFSGRWQTALDSYALDQFPGRNRLRSVKAVANGTLFGRLDNHGLYQWDGSLCKLDYPLNEAQVILGAEKLNSLKERYLSKSRCWYGVIPDKNYYAGQEAGYPRMDYGRLSALLEERVRDMDSVNLFPALTLEDYYRTDAHWRQERLEAVTDVLSRAMGFPAPKLSQWEEQRLENFRGVYAGQSALPLEGEPLVYFTGEAAERAVVYDAETDKTAAVYQPEKFTGMDPYDVYLGGARALLEIETEADTGRELLLFRDSFGSSLAPLLLEAYDRITLIDLRYLSSDKLEETVNFHGQDALFLYSAPVWNNSAMLR